MKKITMFVIVCICGMLLQMASCAAAMEPYTADNTDGSKIYGYIDETGRVKIAPIYEYAGEFSCGYALVRKGGKNYYIDKNANVAFGSANSKYNFYFSFAENLCVASSDGKFGFLDTNGKVVIDFIYDDAQNFSEGLASVCKDGKYGYIDKAGKCVIDFKYEKAEGFKNSLAKVVRNNGKFGFVNKTGEECVPAIYEKAGEFSEGKSCVKLGERYSYVTEDGFICFRPILEEAYSFADGRARIKIDGKYATIYHDGYYCILPEYDYMSDFTEGYAIVGKKAESEPILYGFIDKDGNRVTSMTYESITHVDGIYAAVRNGKTTFFDEKLRVVEGNN